MSEKHIDPRILEYLGLTASTLNLDDPRATILQEHFATEEGEESDEDESDGEERDPASQQEESDGEESGEENGKEEVRETSMEFDWAKSTEGPVIPSVLEPGHALKLYDVEKRKPTLYTFATKQNSETTRTASPQTDLVNTNYTTKQEVDGSAFFTVDMEGLDTEAPENAAQKRRFDRGAVTGDQGPHTQAHIMIAKLFESALPEKLAGHSLERWRAVEEFWVSKMDDPREVFEAIQSELASSARTFEQDFLSNLNNAMVRYVEMFNQGEALLDSVWGPALSAQQGEYGGADTDQYQSWAARDEEMYQTARKLMQAMWELFPYGSYAWQRGGKKATAAELAGKGERGEPFLKALDKLLASKDDDAAHLDALREMAKVIAPMIDGFSQFKSKEQFRRYLMKRMEVISLYDADQLMQLVIKEKGGT